MRPRDGARPPSDPWRSSGISVFLLCESLHSPPHKLCPWESAHTRRDLPLTFSLSRFLYLQKKGNPSLSLVVNDALSFDLVC